MKNNRQIFRKDEVSAGDLVYFLNFWDEIEWLALVLGNIRQSEGEICATVLLLRSVYSENNKVIGQAVIQGARVSRLTDE